MASTGCSTTQITEWSRRASRQMEQTSSSVRFPHSRQKRTRSLTSLTAAASASASSRGRCRMWKASRCAVRVPTPGSFVSWATRFSTEGDSMRGLCPAHLSRPGDACAIIPGRMSVPAPHEAPPLSVVLPTTQPWPELQPCLDAVYDEAVSLGAEVLAVVGTSDALPPDADQRYPALTRVAEDGASVFRLRSLGL